MKIAICKSHFAGPVSGADETLVSYATSLSRAGYAVKVVLLHPYRTDDQYYKRLTQAGVEVACILERSYAYKIMRGARDLFSSLFFFLFLLPNTPAQMRKIWQVVLNWVSLTCLKECREYFAANRPDVLHVITPDTGAALMIRAGHELKIPVLYHELGTPQYLPALDVYYHRLQKVLPLCSEVVALSPHLAAQWKRKYSFLDSISVLPPIIDHAAENSRSVPQSSVNGVIFGYAARMEAGKGPLNLLQAFAKVKQAGHAVQLKMAGAGPQLVQLKLRTRQFGISESCVFTGAYTEPAGRNAFMRSLDVFVLPTLAEGTPNSIIEAMAHGLPVVASAVGGIPEMLTPETGILVPPGDITALTEALMLLAENADLRAQMGHAARARYEKLFSPQAVLPTLIHTYERVASLNGKGNHAAPTEYSLHPWLEPVS